MITLKAEVWDSAVTDSSAAVNKEEEKCPGTEEKNHYQSWLRQRVPLIQPGHHGTINERQFKWVQRGPVLGK